MEPFVTAAQIADGSYIIAGREGSNDGDVTCSTGTVNLLVMKLAPDGEVLWQRCLETHYHGWALVATIDGGFFLVGKTTSNDCGNSGNQGDADAWIVKMDADGEIEWQRCHGGTAYEEIWDLHQTSDGGFVMAGRTTSNDGDVSGNHGDSDAWVVKLNAAGEIQWQKCLGGTANDDARSVQETSDGGYVLAIQTSSDDGNVSGQHGGLDYWVVKLDAGGEIQWQKCLGGTKDDYARTVLQTADDGFIVVGFTWSDDGDVSEIHSEYNDNWVVKLGGTGEIQWQKCFGGTGAEQAYTAIQTEDGGYLIAGESSSNDGDVSSNHGGYDAWLVKFNSAGEIQWQKSYGGTSHDDAQSIHQTQDGGFIMAGKTQSNDGDVSGFHGGMDFWVVKLDGGAVNVKESEMANDIRLYPSPNQGLFTIEIDGLPTGMVELALFSTDCRLLRSESVKNLTRPFTHSFHCSDLTSGVYLMRVGTGMGTVYKKVVVQR
ncbi:MAG: T9SS type A sorting domain-containing protein [Saprospirales bacterium]|nr:T9SS type A sorting domain-containing protein [Saprospirales bacterium]